jgi:hypothetical protein
LKPFLQKKLQEILKKKIILGTSDAWCLLLLSLKTAKNKQIHVNILKIEPLNQMLCLGLNVKLSLSWTQINHPF